MKKIIIFSLLLTVSVASFSQQTTTVTPALTKTDYLQKSKKQKTVARILLGGGGALILTGIIIPKGEVTREAWWSDYKNDGIKSGFVLSGTLAMLGSIPFFIASSKNKKKTLSLSFKNETVPQFYKQSIVSLPLPSLTLKLNL